MKKIHNNNPFSYEGTIGRLGYFLTVLILSIALVILKEFCLSSFYVDSYGLSESSLLIVVILALVSVFIIINSVLKRAWDIGLSRKWTYVLIATLPFLSILVHIYLCVAPPKKESGEVGLLNCERKIEGSLNNSCENKKLKAFKTPCHRVFAVVAAISTLVCLALTVLAILDYTLHYKSSFSEFLKDFVDNVILGIFDEDVNWNFLATCYAFSFYLSIFGWVIALGSFDWVVRIFKWIKTGT